MTAEPRPEPSVPLRPVTPGRLADDVAERLRRYIIDNHLTEGARLPSERALAERLGTSRATVSQALRILAVMGMVDIRHGSGVYIRHDPGSLMGTSLDLMLDLEPGSVTELADFRYWIEQSLLDPERGVLADLDPETVTAGFRAMAESGEEVERWVEADAAFHVALVAATHNRYLVTLYEHVHRKILSLSYADWIRREAVPVWLRGARLEDQLGLHRAILEAAVAGDRAELAAALGRHQEALMEHLARAVDLTP